MNQEEEEKEFNNKPYLILIVVIGITAIFAPWFITSFHSGIVFGAKTGPIGDTIGGIMSPFLSLIGSLLVFMALKSQIEANQKVSTQFKKQETDNIRRDFENTFFQMLQIHHQLVQNMDFDLKTIVEDKETSKDLNELLEYKEKKKINFDHKLTSRDVFKESFLLLDFLIELRLKNNKELNQKLTAKEILDTTYLFIYEYLDADYGHYFRNLYRIFKLIEIQDFNLKDQKKSDELKYYYASIVRSQLSDYEIYWLFFNCLFEYGAKFKPLVENYCVLKILANNKKETITTFKDKYAPEAFEKKQING